MINQKCEQKKQDRTDLKNGTGTIAFQHLLPDTDLPKNCRMLSVMTLKKYTSIGEHKHSKESEIYYILSGKAVYSDGNRISELYPGDTAITKSGEKHSIRNINEEPLVILAMIILD